MTSEQYKQIIRDAQHEYVDGMAKVEILDTAPAVCFALGGGYWVQAWIHVEVRPPFIPKHNCSVVRSIP